jgi:hypothetical protein
MCRYSSVGANLSRSATLGLVIFGAALIMIPNDEPLDLQGKIDWIGSSLGVAGLILFNFVWK